jgi:hypothetical protein
MRLPDRRAPISTGAEHVRTSPLVGSVVGERTLGAPVGQVALKVSVRLLVEELKHCVDASGRPRASARSENDDEAWQERGRSGSSGLLPDPWEGVHHA